MNTDGIYQDGLLRLARPLNGVRALRDHDPFLSDLAGLLTDVKPVIYIDFEPGHWPYLSGLCRKLKLVYLFPEEECADAACWSNLNHSAGNKRHIIIGKRLNKVRKAVSFWRELGNKPWGLSLGYPECCVEHHVSEQNRGADTDTTRKIYENTAGKARLSFLLNDTCNFYSLPGSTRRGADAFRSIQRLNPGLMSAQVISWHPCSYDCAKSLKGGAKIFGFIEHYLPRYAAELKRTLSRPVVMRDKFSFLTFDGEILGGKLRYRGLTGPRTLLPAAAAARVARLSKPAPGGTLELDLKVLPRLGKPAPFLLNYTSYDR